MIVDVHTHFHSRALEGQAGSLGPRFVSDNFGKTFWEIGKRRQAAPEPIYDLAERVRMMDAAGIDLQILSSSPKWFMYNHIHGADTPSIEACIRFCKVQNDDLANAIQTYPGRFAALATLPLGYMAASLDELERVTNDLGMSGVIIDSTVNGEGLDAEMLFPLYERLETKGLPLFVHPSFLPDPRVERLGLRWMLGFCFDESYAIACLVFGGVMDRFPALKVVVSHGGGAVPYLLGRLVDGPLHRRDPQIQAQYPFDHYLRRFYYDSCVYHPAPLRYLASLVGYDRILFGTNFPGSPDLATTTVNELRDVSETDTRKMLGETAREIFGLR